MKRIPQAGWRLQPPPVVAEATTPVTAALQFEV
jgi:hypothetical protein